MNWIYKYRPEKGGEWPFSLTFAGPTGDLYLHSDDIYNWCFATFEGKSWFSANSKFYFKEKSQAEMFILRWS